MASTNTALGCFIGAKVLYTSIDMSQAVSKNTFSGPERVEPLPEESFLMNLDRSFCGYGTRKSKPIVSRICLSRPTVNFDGCSNV